MTIDFLMLTIKANKNNCSAVKMMFCFQKTWEFSFNIPFGQLTTACNPSSRGSDILFRQLHSFPHCTYTHPTQTYLKIKIFKSDTFKFYFVCMCLWEKRKRKNRDRENECVLAWWLHSTFVKVWEQFPRVGSLLIVIIFHLRIGWRYHAQLFLIAHHVFHLNKDVLSWISNIMKFWTLHSDTIYSGVCILVVSATAFSPRGTEI